MPVQVQGEFTLSSAAVHTKGFAHQLDAWAWLQNAIEPKVLEEFKLRYRNSFRQDKIETQYRCPDTALEIIKDFEGFRDAPYRCPAGVWTIGYGTTRYPDGSRVTQDDFRISEKQAALYMREEIEKEIIPTLAKTVPFWGAMDTYKQSALISFAYNLGTGFMQAGLPFETLQKALRNKDWGKVPDALSLYRKADGRVMDGLVRRRTAESELWKGIGDYVRA